MADLRIRPCSRSPFIGRNYITADQIVRWVEIVPARPGRVPRSYPLSSKYLPWGEYLTTRSFRIAAAHLDIAVWDESHICGHIEDVMASARNTLGMNIDQYIVI